MADFSICYTSQMQEKITINFLKNPFICTVKSWEILSQSSQQNILVRECEKINTTVFYWEQT